MAMDKEIILGLTIVLALGILVGVLFPLQYILIGFFITFGLFLLFG